MHRWKLSLLATAAALTAGLYATDASALALGRISVQSALGEPLRAEIALPSVTQAEADSLRVNIASPEVFRAQGMEYAPAINGIHVELKQRPNGRMVLQISSNNAMNDPFVDLVIDAAWNAGHIVRSYTMLFDPPGAGSAAPTAAPQVSRDERASAAPPVRAPSVAAAQRAATAPAAPAPRAKAPETPAGDVKVQTGDTAGAIASAHRPSGVSLDQMLVAMVRANPHAFVDGNANRLRAGAVLQLPARDDALATSAVDARKMIAAQSRDFNAFRRRLAGAAPKATVEAPSRTTTGTVQTQVQESKPEAASADKLTLSKAGASTQAANADTQTAQTRQADQTTARMAELSKNISELNELSNGAASEAAQATTAAPAAADAQSAGVDAGAGALAPAASEAASTQAQAPMPAETEPKPAAAPAAAPAAPAETGLLATLAEDPLRSGGILALLLLVLGWAGYRWKQSRRDHESPETAFIDEPDHADSFFAESGGEDVDTNNSDLTTGSASTLYTPSQGVEGGDVDPIAEADVYLAYGKDPQAEEILKEAALHHPDLAAIPAKLAEIYAKRQDRVGLESVARQVHDLTHGQGPEWDHVRELGHALDSRNALYQPPMVPAVNLASSPAPAVAQPQAPAAPPVDSLLPEIDLDLDLDDVSAAPTKPSAAASAFTAAAAGAAERTLESLVPDSGLGALAVPASLSEPAPPSAEPEPKHITGALEFSTDDLSLANSGAAPLTGSETAPSTEPSPLGFDLAGLSLDLDTPPTAHASADTAAADLSTLTSSLTADSEQPLPDDPLSTKLALAEEFNSIGDSEGARSLIEEVLAEATGELKTKAQTLLGTLS